jgi:hypothetical protein
MKQLLVVMLALITSSAFAETNYECSSKVGKILVTSTDNNEATIDFSSHPVAKGSYFYFSYFSILNEPYRDFDHSKLTISNETFTGAKRGKFENNINDLIANSSGRADFSTYRIKFKLDKRSLIAKVNYKVSTWLIPETIHDKLNCVKY